MKLFNREKSDAVIIVGCGRFGAALATTGSNRKLNITVIDIDTAAFNNLPASYRGFSIEGDGTDMNTLETAGILSADVLVAATDDDNTNLMIAQIAKQHYKVEHVVARIYDDSKEVSCGQIGIETVCPVVLSISEAQEIIFNAKEEKAV